MRKVRHLVGGDNTVDNSGTVRGQPGFDRRQQFARLGGVKAVAAARLRERNVIRIGKFDAFFIRRQADRFRFERDQAESELLYTTTLTGSL